MAIIMNAVLLIDSLVIDFSNPGLVAEFGVALMQSQSENIV